MSSLRSTSALMTRRSVALLAGAALTVSVLGGCTHKKATATDSGPLPAAADLMTQSEQAMSDLQSVHFGIDVKGALPGLPLRSAEGDLTRDGSAKGSASITGLGTTIQADFVILGQSFYLKAGTGGYQKLPLATASSIYDPSAILDPNRGLVKLMASAQNPKVETKEQVDGQDAYRVALTPDPGSINALIPGAGAGTTGKIWIEATTHRVVKGVFTIPGSGSQGATVTITISKFNTPVTISAP